MNLYGRDYSVLKPDEAHELQRIRRENSRGWNGKFGGIGTTRVNFRDYPKALRHYDTLFPNHYLDIVELEDRVRLRRKLQDFKRLLSRRVVGERQLQEFINKKRNYFIIGSLFEEYNFGHHDAFLFYEFPLGRSYSVDYLLVGRNSGGHEFVFVELESPNGNTVVKSGHVGDAIRKGRRQVDDWDHWLNANYYSLAEVFAKYKHPKMDLPIEFLQFDKTRLHYLIVAGRRIEYNNTTYRQRRKEQQDSNVKVLHYDNLLDHAGRIIGAPVY